jgi:hypothetical protein
LLAADLDVADAAIGQRRVVVGADAQLAARNGLPHRHQFDRIAAASAHDLRARAHAKVMAIQQQRAVVLPVGGKVTASEASARP